MADDRTADEDAAARLEARAAAMLSAVLRRTHLSAPGDLPRVLREEAAQLGALDVAMFLVDYDLRALAHVAAAGEDQRPAVDVLGTLAGRAFTDVAILRARGRTEDEELLWLPLLDGTERLGVLSVTLPAGTITEDVAALYERLAHLSAILVVTKGAYTDRFEQVRRARPMTIATELVRALAPPMVFATDHVVLCGMLEPAYDSGGDALDYALNDEVLHFAVFDAMGHGLPAAGVAAFALSAYRASRRAGHDLVRTHEAIDEAISAHYPDERFVTALLAELDVATGRLSYVVAGHPLPLLVREGRGKVLDGTPVPPLGLGAADVVAPRVTSLSLQPGDLLLLVSDGLTEAWTSSGDQLGADGLLRFVEREAAAGVTPPEVLRRVRQVLVGGDLQELRDDATALLVAWRDDGERRLMPRAVVGHD